MPDNLKEFDVTVSRIGTARVFAENAEAAMTAVNNGPIGFIRWMDEFSATDAEPVDDGK